MNKKDHKILAQDKRKLQKRLGPKAWADQAEPMFQAANLHYRMSERSRVLGCGGMGAIHRLVTCLGLDQALNENLSLLKVHVPYFESDHVLNIAYNVVTGGTCLEDIDRLRDDDHYTRSLAAERIPDPTTAGDFLRRLSATDIEKLQDTFNQARQKVWRRKPARFRRKAILDVDGTHAATTGECKAGMDISYKGIWGYAPLVISLANSKEPLYLVNRPGNATSSSEAAPWIDRAIDLVGEVFAEVWLRGDTDFSLTQHLDRWNSRVRFVLGYNAYASLIERAEQLPARAWRPLERPAPYSVLTEPRQRPDNIKQQIIRAREYKNIRLESEQVAEFDYRPTHCQHTYRMVVVRKNLSIEKGDHRLFDEIRYFFYITNDRSMTSTEVVLFANQRCDQENVIEQLKNGVNALRMPTEDLLSNWAYMVIAALAWSLKSWYGLLVPNPATGQAIVRMEFKHFLRRFILIPCQVVHTGRRLILRVLTYTRHLETFFKTFDRLKRLRFA